MNQDGRTWWLFAHLRDSLLQPVAHLGTGVCTGVGGSLSEFGVHHQGMGVNGGAFSDSATPMGGGCEGGWVSDGFISDGGNASDADGGHSAGGYHSDGAVSFVSVDETDASGAGGGGSGRQQKKLGAGGGGPVGNQLSVPGAVSNRKSKIESR